MMNFVIYIIKQIDPHLNFLILQDIFLQLKGKNKRDYIFECFSIPKLLHI